MWKNIYIERNVAEIVIKNFFIDILYFLPMNNVRKVTIQKKKQKNQLTWSKMITFQIFNNNFSNETNDNSNIIII